MRTENLILLPVVTPVILMKSAVLALVYGGGVVAVAVIAIPIGWWWRVKAEFEEWVKP